MHRGSNSEHESSVEKALAILESVVGEERPVATTELAAKLALTKPTAHRLAVLLEKENFLQREPGTRRFVGGKRLIDLALAAVEASAREGARHAILQSLSDDVGETCNFGLLAGSEIVYLDRVESHWPLNLKFERGSRVPLHCTAIGKVLLSHLPVRQRHQLVHCVPLKAYTRNTITDPERLEAELQMIHGHGFAIDNQEYLDGVVCAAVPVTIPEVRNCAGLAVSAPLVRMDTEAARRHIPALLRAAEHMSKTFGEAFPERDADMDGQDLFEAPAWR